MVVIRSLGRERMGLVGTVAVFFRMCLWAMREIGICRDDGTQYLPPGGRCPRKGADEERRYVPNLYAFR